MAASKEDLDLLHAELAKAMKDKIASGEFNAADLNVIRQFLKDNHIDAAPTADSPLDKLRSTLPFPASDEDAERLLN